MQKKNLLTYLSFAHYVTDKAAEILINNYKSKSFFSSKKKIASVYELVTDIDSRIENKAVISVGEFENTHIACDGIWLSSADQIGLMDISGMLSCSELALLGMLMVVLYISPATISCM